MDRNPLDSPKPGYFKTRLVRNGPWIGAKIFKTPCQCTINGGDENEKHIWNESCDRYPHPELSAEIDGRPANMTRVWEFSTEVDEKEFNYLTSSARWDRQNDPDSPYVTPDKAIDINKIKPVGP